MSWGQGASGTTIVTNIIWNCVTSVESKMQKQKHSLFIPFKLYCLATLVIEISCLICGSEVEVVEGEPLELECRSEFRIDSCEFRYAGRRIKVYAGVKTEYYEFLGNFSSGECGIRFLAATRKLHGEVVAEVTFPDEDNSAQAKINVVVWYAPEFLHIDTNNHNYEFKEGEPMTFNCSCSDSNPSPNVTLLLGDVELGAVENNNCVNSSKLANVNDFNKKLTCIARHPQLGNQQLTYARIITILYGPKFTEGQYSVEGEFEIGKNATIKVPVSAYPMPRTCQWTTQDGKYLDRNRFTSRLDHADNTASTTWNAYLVIENITEDDLRLSFTLNVTNDEGFSTMMNILPISNISTRTMLSTAAKFFCLASAFWSFKWFSQL